MATLEKISKKYGYKSIFSNFDLQFADEKINVIMGKSGIGKTTLLNILAGITSYEGSITLQKPISYIFQTPRLIEHLTVGQNLSYVLSPTKQNKAQINADIRFMLEKTGMGDKINCYPSSLSGGEKQRVSLIRAFMYPSKTLLMDEPFSSIDYALKRQLIDLLLDFLQKMPKTVIYVTHDIDEALTLADTLFVLGNNSVLLNQTLSQEQKPRELSQPSLITLRKLIYNCLSE